MCVCVTVCVRVCACVYVWVLKEVNMFAKRYRIVVLLNIDETSKLFLLEIKCWKVKMSKF